MTSGIQRDGTRKAGMSSQSTREGIQTSGPRTEIGLGARGGAPRRRRREPDGRSFQLRGQVLRRRHATTSQTSASAIVRRPR